MVKKTKCTKLIMNISILLLAVIIIAVIPTENESAIYDDTIRLHILANSDSREDQELKLGIRDMVLEKYGQKLSGYGTKEEALDRISNLTPDIKRDVDERLREHGKKYTSRVEIGLEWYDTRKYEDFTLPCGYYSSLRIMLGEAEGQNWWCVMYPPLCLDIATESAPTDDGVINYTKEETRLISKGGYNLKFKILELMSEAFADFSKNG